MICRTSREICWTRSEIALHRLEHQGWIEAEWAVSELGRRAKYYRLTPSGRRQLRVEIDTWERMSTAIGRVMKLA